MLTAATVTMAMTTMVLDFSRRLTRYFGLIVDLGLILLNYFAIIKLP